jgi:hypothetical protein
MLSGCDAINLAAEAEPDANAVERRAEALKHKHRIDLLVIGEPEAGEQAWRERGLADSEVPERQGKRRNIARLAGGGEACDPFRLAGRAGDNQRAFAGVFDRPTAKALKAGGLIRPQLAGMSRQRSERALVMLGGPFESGTEHAGCADGNSSPEFDAAVVHRHIRASAAQFERDA